MIQAVIIDHNVFAGIPLSHEIDILVSMGDNLLKRDILSNDDLAASPDVYTLGLKGPIFVIDYIGI